MEENSTITELLDFYKALADINRLKIIGLLAQGEYSVEQIADMLNIKPPTVSHHLNRLTKAGLVQSRTDSYYSLYRLDEDNFEQKTRSMLSRENLPSLAVDVDMDAFDKKVLKTAFDADGKLKFFPKQHKKLMVVLHFISQSFEKNRTYSEKEVNEILKQFHQDFASIRRDLIDYRLLVRSTDGSAYTLG